MLFRKAHVVQSIVNQTISEDIIVQERRILVFKWLVPYTNSVHQNQIFHIPQAIFHIIATDENRHRQILVGYNLGWENAVPPSIELCFSSSSLYRQASSSADPNHASGNQFATVPDCTGFRLNALGIQPQHRTADEQILIVCLAAGEKCTSTEQGFRFNGDIIIHDQNVRNVTLLLHPIDFNHSTVNPPAPPTFLFCTMWIFSLLNAGISKVWALSETKTSSLPCKKESGFSKNRSFSSFKFFSMNRSRL